MNLMGISKEYHSKQAERINKVFGRLAKKTDVVSVATAIPDAEDLLISEGRATTASVLFLDISKFSSRATSDAASQAVMLRLLTVYFTEMIRVIDEYGGTVEKNTGDGLMAYFVSDDEGLAQHKAVAASMSIFKAAGDFIHPQVQLEGLQPLRFRICIDHGAITVAKVGAPRLFNGIVAIGSTANIASKMLAFADADQILLGENVLNGLPTDWMRHVSLKSADTGWIYAATNAPYRFWLFDGRWITP